MASLCTLLVTHLVGCQAGPATPPEVSPANRVDPALEENAARPEPEDVAPQEQPPPPDRDDEEERAAGEAESAATPPAGESPRHLPNGEAILPCEEPPPGMVCIPGGPFVRGADDDEHRCDQPSYNKKGQANTGPQAEVWLQTFYMDRTEVTVEAFKACIKAKKCDKAGPRYNDFSRPQQAITGISWYDAENFCRVMGKALPTEAQWEKGARGTEAALFPWGDAPADCERAVIMNAKGERSCGITKSGNSPEKGRVLEVCSRPAGIYDLCDMAGNAEEWVADWYSHDYASCGEDCAGVDPLGPCQGAATCAGHRYKVVRGGSWYWPAAHATAIHRRSHVPSNDPFHHFGFRCAASAAAAKDLREPQP